MISLSSSALALIDSLLVSCSPFFAPQNESIFSQVKTQSNLPLITNIALVKELVNELRPTQKMDAIGDTLCDGIPAAVANKTSNGRVS
jgi:hypothetical protein